MKNERRRKTDHESGDRFTKQLIIWTLCLIAGLFAATVCAMCLTKMAIPDALDRLITFIVGNLTGMLAKTGIDAALSVPTPVTTLPGDKVTTAPANAAPNTSEQEIPDDH